MKRIGLMLILVIALMLTACGKESTDSVPETATTVEEITKDLSSYDISSNDSAEASVEDNSEPEYTFKDCFDEDAVLIENIGDFYAYLDSNEALTIRAYATKRTFPNDTTKDIENSVCEEVFNYATYIGMYKADVENEKGELEEISAINVYNVNGSNLCVPIKNAYDIDIPTNASISDVYKMVIKSIGMNNYGNTIFIPKNTPLTQDRYDTITDSNTNGSCRIVSDYPKEAVFDILNTGDEYKSLEAGYLCYELKDDGNKNIIPTHINGFTQYINDNNQMVAYTLTIILIPSEYAAIDEFLNASCTCGGGCGCGCDEIDAFTFNNMDAVKYVKMGMNVRNLPTTNGEIITSLKENEKVYITGQCNETGWYRIDYNGQTVYGSNEYLRD